MTKTYLVPVTDELIKAMEKGEAPSFLHCATCLDGLTNGEVFKKVFQKAEVDETNRGYAILKLKSTHNGEPYIADRVSVWNSVWNRKWGE